MMIEQLKNWLKVKSCQFISLRLHWFVVAISFGLALSSATQLRFGNYSFGFSELFLFALLGSVWFRFPPTFSASEFTGAEKLLISFWLICILSSFVGFIFGSAEGLLFEKRPLRDSLAIMFSFGLSFCG